MDFPSSRLRFASVAIHLFGASILAYCFTAYTRSGHLLWKNWRQIPWARLCIMLVFIDSWLFHVSAGLLLQGPGISNNELSCNMAIYICITIYCLSKVLIYSFLIERVYVVWPHNGTRLSSKAYCLCALTMLGYVVVTTLMIVGRIAFFDSEHRCIIGLKGFASIPLLSYDLFLNIFLTSMFLWPLQQAHFRDVRLRKIATRTLFAAIMALTTSAINITVLTIKHGQEFGWICLLSCGLDVTINALVIYWVSGYRPDDTPNPGYLTTINFTLPYSTQSIMFSSARQDRTSRPELAVPPPTMDRAKTHRPASICIEETGSPHTNGDFPTWQDAHEPELGYPIMEWRTEDRPSGRNENPSRWWPQWRSMFWRKLVEEGRSEKATIQMPSPPVVVRTSRSHDDGVAMSAVPQQEDGSRRDPTSMDSGRVVWR